MSTRSGGTRHSKPQRKKNKVEENAYLHGYSRKEQNRLYRQAQSLRDFVYAGVDLANVRHLLEVGSGVGAQTAILLEKFPQLEITCVDISPVQIRAALQHLQKLGFEKRVHFHQLNAEDLSPIENSAFDAAFICWFLEHVPNPTRVLSEVHKKLKPGALVYCSEVLNACLFVHPYSPAILKYWFQFNDYAWTLKGHPFLGAQLGNFLLETGFKDIKLETRPMHFDSREPKQRQFYIREFKDLLLSAYPGLLKSRKVTPKLVHHLKKEIAMLVRAKDSVLYQAWIRATARR